MKYIILLFFAALIPAWSLSQTCKPDYDKPDKISKLENKAWDCILYETGLGNSLINSSDWYLSIQFGRFGNVNAVSIFVSKYEESAQNAALESKFSGEKGKEYALAFTKGEPLTLVVHSTSTSTKMNNLLGKLVTTTILTTALTDDLINDFKSRFEGGELNAVQVMLKGDVNLSKEIKPNKAANAKEKFSCFYDFNSKNKLKKVEEPELNNLPPNPNVPETLPIDTTTNKISFSGVVTVEGTSKDKLFERAKSWMVNYYKNEQFSINNKEEGRIAREGMFEKTYNIGNGKTSTDKNIYRITISVKEGRYKYELTDFVGDDGKAPEPLERALERLANYTKFTKYVNQQIYEGVDEVLVSMKKAMSADPSAQDDW